MISDGRENHARRRDTPPASSAAVRRRMQATRQTGTKAELRLCEALTRLGLHYATDEVVIPGVPSRADVVFFSARVAVFVDGCFWHGCPSHRTLPKSNGAWWRAKLAANRRRDLRTTHLLRKAGWVIVRVWEHRALRTPERAARTIADRVSQRLDPRKKRG
jgi:DNA mismatch endonuclease, patch repair protein